MAGVLGLRDPPLVDVLERQGDNQRRRLVHAGDLGDDPGDEVVDLVVVPPDHLDADVDVAEGAGDVRDARVTGQLLGGGANRGRLDLQEDVGHDVVADGARGGGGGHAHEAGIGQG